LKPGDGLVTKAYLVGVLTFLYYDHIELIGTPRRTPWLISGRWN